MSSRSTLSAMLPESGRFVHSARSVDYYRQEGAGANRPENGVDSFRGRSLKVRPLLFLSLSVRIFWIVGLVLAPQIGV
jgi:hypothetical protein